MSRKVIYMVICAPQDEMKDERHGDLLSSFHVRHPRPFPKELSPCPFPSLSSLPAGGQSRSSLTNVKMNLLDVAGLMHPGRLASGPGSPLSITGPDLVQILITRRG